jgi:6-phosphogluconolactonase/glucosamine-6-phosphate isomerase/deaminase
VSITLSAIAAARRVLFIVAGEEKAEAVRRVFDPDQPVPPLPGRLASDAAADVRWILDRGAASRLRGTRLERA